MEHLSNMQEASTVSEVVRSMTRINVALDDHQEKYLLTVIECEGMIPKQSIFVLFYLGANLSYVSPKVVEICQLQSSKYKQSWLVQLATGTKRKMSVKTKNCHIIISGQPI